MEECIFCAIAQGRIPSSCVYEDEQVFVFMDINPIIKGHVLVIPRVHYVDIKSVPEETLAVLHITAKRIADVQMNELRADGVNIVQNNGAAAGQEIGHIHVHVIPRYTDDKHRWNWKTKPYDKIDEMDELAKKMQSGLQEL